MNNSRRLTVTPNQSFSVIFFQHCKIKFLHSASYSNLISIMQVIYTISTPKLQVQSVFWTSYSNLISTIIWVIYAKSSTLKSVFNWNILKEALTHRVWSSTIDSHSFKCLWHMQKNLMGLFVNCDYEAGKYDELWYDLELAGKWVS